MTRKYVLTYCMSLLIIGSISFIPFISAEEITNIDEYLYPEVTNTISMDFQDAKLTNVLKVLSQQSGMNFVASGDVAKKEINLYMDNVPVGEALERILEANNLTYELNPGSNIFVVKELTNPALDLITRIYQLKNATVPTHLMNNMLTFNDTIGDSSSGGGEGSTSSGDTASASPSSSGGSEEGIISAIKSVLSDDGSVVEDKRTNSVVITDHPSQFTLIELTIARLDIRIPQILIEAEMLDVSKGTTDLLGAKFSGDFLELTQGSAKRGNFPFDSQDNSARGDGLNDYTAFSSLSFQKFNFLIQFLRTQSDTRNLARPRIMTLNNQTATIAIKTDEAVGLKLESSSSGTSSTTTEEAERSETGVFLKVTPYANVLTKEITMAVEPKVIEARQSTTFSQFRDPEERGTKAILRVIDGDTIIIGGLLRTDVTDIHTKIPVIGDVPIVGAAFRHKNKKESQRELIVFLTPHILDEHLATNDRSSQQEQIVREQSAPNGSRWNAINGDMNLTESY